jgi:ornithine cyclodeaminase
MDPHNQESYPKIFHDSDVDKKLNMRAAIVALEEVFLRVSSGRFLNPPRHVVKNKNGALVFTVGGDQFNGIIGFRVYDTFPSQRNNHQYVSVYDTSTGTLKGLVFGNLVGAIRTGAIGGVAIKYLSKTSSRSLGVIGTGLQAQFQLQAALEVRDIETVHVFSRNKENREQFARDWGKKLRRKIMAVSSAEQAVIDKDIVITATNSSSIVFDPKWLKPGAHVTTVGPKLKDRHELDPIVAESAQHIFTDSIEQLKSYPSEHFLAQSASFNRIQDLSKLVGDSKTPLGDSGDKTLFLSVGLSGTEPIVANLLFS